MLGNEGRFRGLKPSFLHKSFSLHNGCNGCAFSHGAANDWKASARYGAHLHMGLGKAELQHAVSIASPLLHYMQRFLTLV